MTIQLTHSSKIHRFADGSEMQINWDGTNPSVAHTCAYVLASALGNVIGHCQKSKGMPSVAFPDLSDEQCASIFAEYVYELVALVESVYEQAREDAPEGLDERSKDKFLQAFVDIYKRMCFLFFRVRAYCQKMGYMLSLIGKFDLGVFAHVQTAEDFWADFPMIDSLSEVRLTTQPSVR